MGSSALFPRFSLVSISHSRRGRLVHTPTLFFHFWFSRRPSISPSATVPLHSSLFCTTACPAISSTFHYLYPLLPHLIGSAAPPFHLSATPIPFAIFPAHSPPLIQLSSTMGPPPLRSRLQHHLLRPQNRGQRRRHRRTPLEAPR